MTTVRFLLLLIVLAAAFTFAACRPVPAEPVLEEHEDTSPTSQPILPTPVEAGEGVTPVSPDDLAPTDSAGPIDPVLEEFVTDAKRDLAERLGIAVETIDVVETESVDWPDSALGCPEPDEEAAQVITSGYRIQLAVDETLYEYHTALDWMRFCPELP